MFFIKDHKTIDMFDRFAHLGPKRRALLDRTWARLFRDEVLLNLPVHLLRAQYDPANGRPTHELHAMMGAMVLQQMHDLTDQQTVEHFSFNLQWHFALNITNPADACSYVCERSIWEMRRIMADNDLYQPMFAGVSDHLCKLFEVDTTMQRLDSVHLFSNMRHLGRIRLFAATIRKFLVNLKRHHQALFATLPKELGERYLEKRAESAFAMVKPSDSSRTLEELGKDVFFLTERFGAHRLVTGMTSFRLLVRLLTEQCIVAEDPESKTRKVTVKPNCEVPSDSLQNPSDPDATYDGHKGKGYQAQVAETYSEDEERKSLRLITHIEVEAAHQSDVHAVQPFLEETGKRGILPFQTLADTLYGSDQNCEKARQLGVELIAPTMVSGTTGEISLTDFILAKNDAVTACPAGCTPEKMKIKKERCTAVFSLEHCATCPRKGVCPVVDGKLGCYLRYGRKAARLARRRAWEKTEAFREKYRFRAGVEATMSEFDRRTGVKHLRVRGMKAVRFSVFLKATGLNILRAAAFRAKNNITTTRQRDRDGSGRFYQVCSAVKERMATFLRHLGKIPMHILQNHQIADCQDLRLAA